jgi:hypothetical protein
MRIATQQQQQTVVERRLGEVGALVGGLQRAVGCG